MEGLEAEVKEGGFFDSVLEATVKPGLIGTSLFSVGLGFLTSFAMLNTNPESALYMDLHPAIKGFYNLVGAGLVNIGMLIFDEITEYHALDKLYIKTTEFSYALPR